jgi:hypothetical protein
LSSSQALALTVPASRSVMIENGCVIACNPATLFVVTEDGAYVRANFLPTERGYKPCYVRSGVWHDRDRDYPGVCGLTPRAAGTALPLEWEMFTQEPEPRRILAYPRRIQGDITKGQQRELQYM